MKLTKERVAHMAQSLLTKLQAEGVIEITGEKKVAVEALLRAITYELQAEDRLNAEVKELMRAYESEIEKGQVDYQKMFTLIKNKLVKDRGVIL